MILGDSLMVMTSLAEKEGLKGQVQMIYVDPPYGIKFGSNWQVSTRKRDVKDGKATDATRQPEQVRAFRDTWELGIHSYLSYLRDRFVVVSDVYPTVTTDLASVVLPSAMWVEKNGVYGNSERRTQQWFKMIDPPGDARDDVWQVIAVARRLYELGHRGMRNRQGGFLFDFKDEQGKPIEAWKWDVFKDVNIDRYLYEEYRPFTQMKHKDVAPYDSLVEARGLRWPVVQGSDGAWKETPRRFVSGEDPFVADDREVDFYWGKQKDHRATIWARPYEAPPEVPDKDYPFWLCTGRVLEHWHTGTMTRRVPQLHRAMPKAYVELNPADADRMNIATGTSVRLVTRRGEIILPAWLNGRSIPMEGSVFVPFFAEEALINHLTLEAYCPLSKEPDYKKCAVRIEKV